MGADVLRHLVGRFDVYEMESQGQEREATSIFGPKNNTEGKR